MPTVKNPESLNNLLEEVLLTLFDQAQDGFEDHTGKAVKISSLDKMKITTAKRLVNMALRHMNKHGNAEAKFEKFIALSEEHLPKALDIVGEEAVLSRLQKVPKNKRDKDVVDRLNDAGATEIAKLLRKAWPEARVPEAAPVAAVAVAAAVAPAVAAAAAKPPVKPGVAMFEAAAERHAAATAPAPAPTPAQPVRKGSLREELTASRAALQEQLDTMKAMKVLAENSIPGLEERIASLDGMLASGHKPAAAETEAPAAVAAFASAAVVEPPAPAPEPKPEITSAIGLAREALASKAGQTVTAVLREKGPGVRRGPR